ncbi:MAG: CHAT domain-containing protein [Anaerolineae bacterium]|nr:CHAT domain-containing protein [Anaerolineae bacterium]
MSSPVYADLEIYVMPKTAKGYPVQIRNEGREFPKGYLPAEIASWLRSQNPERDGEQLYQMLLADGALRDAWVESRGRSANRRIRIRIDEDAPELHPLPWEIMREKTAGVITKTIAADSRTPFSRYLAGPWEPGQAVRARPLKILVAVADPQGLERFNLQPVDAPLEHTIIRDALAGLDPQTLHIHYLPPPITLSRIEAELQNGYHILHLVGHGFFNEKKGAAFFYMADKDNQVQPVTEEKFAEMMGRQVHMPQLVFLTSCQTAVRSPADAFRGFAPKLVMAGVPAVVAMQDLVGVEAAQVLEGAFYRRLIAHGRVDLACNEARAQVLSENLPAGWNVPVLFSRLPDGRLLLVDEPGESPTAAVGQARVQNGQIRLDLTPEQAARINEILNLSADVPPQTTAGTAAPTAATTEQLGNQLDMVLQAVDAAATSDPDTHTDSIRLGNQIVSRSELLLRKAILLLTNADFTFNEHLQKKMLVYQQGNIDWEALPPLPTPDSYKGQIWLRVYKDIQPWVEHQFDDPDDLEIFTQTLANFMLTDYDFTTTQAQVHEAYDLLLTANELEPTNIPILLQMARALIWISPSDISDEIKILNHALQLLHSPSSTDEWFHRAQALLMLASNQLPPDIQPLQMARAIFVQLNEPDWVQECDALWQSVPPAQFTFQPAGGRWRVDINDQAGSVMVIDFHANGQFEAVQSGVGFQLQAHGFWGYDPQKQLLQFQGYVNQTNPFTLAITLQGMEGQQVVGQGFDGLAYRLTRMA